jgi:hypothetical protein
MMAKDSKPKTQLGQSVSANELSLVNTISQALNAPAAAAAPPRSPTGEPLFEVESSPLENSAAAVGAELLFHANKEGCISALGIVLIPDENKQNRRVAAVSDAFGFVAQLNKRKKIAVLTPKGYVTDFASIPGFAQWIISPFGKHAEAAVVHDWLYTLGTPGDRKGRLRADRTFKRALKLVGVGPIRRNVMFWCVRMGGKGGYGLESDFDFRDLPALNRRDPLPDRAPLMSTFHELDIPKPSKKKAQDKYVATQAN